MRDNEHIGRVRWAIRKAVQACFTGRAIKRTGRVVIVGKVLEPDEAAELCASLPRCAVTGDLAKFKILNRHGLNMLLLDLYKEVKLVRLRRQVYSHRDDIKTWADNAVLVGDSKSSTMYDLAKNNIVRGSILFFG